MSDTCVIPATFTVGGRTYRIHPVVQEENDVEIYWRDVRTLGLEIGAAMDKEDGEHIYKHYREIPKDYRGGFAYSKGEGGIIWHQEWPNSEDWKDKYGNAIYLNPGVHLAFPDWEDTSGNYILMMPQNQWWNIFPRSLEEPVYIRLPRMKIHGYSHVHLVSRES
ncbi:MAG: hypothetical protein AAB400_00885 [Patescibacteria group bacterium]